MSGKNAGLKALESRKQLLIAESELNRAHLVHEWQTMAGDVHALTNQAKSIATIASTTASLVAGFRSFRSKKSAPTAEKPSWWRTMLKVAGMASAVWSSYRERSRPE